MAVLINKTNRLLLAILLTLLAMLLGLVYLRNIGDEIPAAVLDPVSQIQNYNVLSAPEPPESIETENTDIPVATPTISSPEASDISEDKPDQSTENTPSAPHDGFVYLKEAFPDAKFDVRYATAHNFTGQVVEGYLSDNISISLKAAEALKKASAIVKKEGYGLLVYDAYRPKRAVDSFIAWGSQPENNLTKAEFYPDFEKNQLFKLGYLAKRSAHSRGSTIDLTLFDIATGEPLDMGSPYDFLGPVSNHGSPLISETQAKNRNILKDAMKAAGFKELRTEWWHYELINEPFPKTFFDFVIE